MNPDKLFIARLDDIEKKLLTNAPYEILCTAGILRQLLTDGQPLLTKVKKGRNSKVIFKVSNLAPVTVALSWFLLDGLDPEDSPSGNRTKELSLPEFLKVPVIMHEGNMITVKDVIRYVSHVLGAVHTGTAKDNADKILQEIDSYMVIGGGEASIYTLKGICRVVLAGLKPLKDEIEAF